VAAAAPFSTAGRGSGELRNLCPINGLQQDETGAVEPGQHGVVLVDDFDHLDAIGGEHDIDPRETLILLETDGYGAIGVEDNPLNPTP
jgi:hypothetical protein